MWFPTDIAYDPEISLQSKPTQGVGAGRQGVNLLQEMAGQLWAEEKQTGSVPSPTTDRIQT